MSDGRVVISVDVDGKDVKSLNGDLDQLEGKASKAGGGIKQMATAFGLVKVAGAAIGILKSSMDGAIKRLDTLNNADRVFSNMGFSVEDTKKTMENLKASIQGLPTPLDGAVKSVQLLASSTGDLDKSQKVFSALNNGILGFGGSTEQVENAVVQLSQAFSNGKVDAETWNSMIDSGLGPALNALAKQMGMTTGEMKAGLSDGTISVETFQNALIKLNEEGGGGLKSLQQIAKDATAGIGTGMANMKTAVVRGLANIIGKFDEITKKLTGKTIGENITVLSGMIDTAFTSAVNAMDKIIPAIERVKKFFQENETVVKRLAMAVGVLVGSFVYLKVINSIIGSVSGLATAFKSAKVILTGLLNPVALVIAAIGVLVGAFVYFYKTNDKFKATVDGILGNAKKLAANIGTIVQMIGAYFTDFSGKFQELREKLVEAVGPELAGKITHAMAQVLSPIADMVKGVQAVIKILSGSIKSMDDLSGFLEGAFTEEGESRIMAIAKAIGNFKDGIKNILSPIKDAGKGFDVVGIALKVLKSVFLTLLGPIGLFVKAFELIAKAIGGGDVSKGIDTIVESFANLASGILENGPLIGTSAGQAIEGILTAIADALPGIIVGGLSIIAAIVSGIAQGLPTLALAASQLIMAFTGAILLLVPQIALSATAIIVAILASLTAGLPQIIVAGGALILALLAGITEQLPLFVESVATLIVTWLTALTEYLPEIVVAGMSLLIAFLDGITQKLPDLVVKVGELIVAFLTALSGQMPSIVTAGADLLINFLNGLASKMPDIVSAALNLIVQFVNGLASKAGDVIKAGVNLIVQILEGIADNIDRIVDAGMDIVDAAVEGVLDAQDRLFQAAIRLVNGMADNIRNNRDKMTSAGENLLSAIIEGIPGSGLVSAGYNLIMGMAEGIGNAASSAVAKAKRVASDIVGGVKGFLGIHSPSRLMRDMIGKNMMLGWEIGIDKNARRPQLAMAGAIEAVLPDVTAERALANRIDGSRTGQIINNSYSTINNQSREGSAIYEFDIPVVVDGREIARATATYTKDEIEKIATRKNIIKKGRDK